MPRNSKPEQVEQLELDAELRQEIDELRQERDDLRRENQDLRERDGEVVPPPSQSEEANLNAGWFMITVAVLVLGRLALLHFIENGKPIHIPKTLHEMTLTWYLNGLFLIVGLPVLGKWLIAEWRAIDWGLVSKGTFVLVSIACALSRVKTHPYIALIYLVAALYFAASPGFEKLMGVLLVFAHHPLETIGRLKEHSDVQRES